MKEYMLAIRCNDVAEALVLARRLMRDPAVLDVQLSRRPPTWVQEIDLEPPTFTNLRPEPS